MFTALLDTCVLVPSLQRDVLLQCAAAGVYRPVWSTAILEELSYTLTRLLTAQNRSGDEVSAYVTRLCQQMNRAFPDATVTGREGLLPTITVPDPDDAHVAAAAITADAGIIVTSVASPPGCRPRSGYGPRTNSCWMPWTWPRPP